MSDNTDKFVEVTAPTNIAIVKYWGKRCQKLNLPLNSSLSATLSQDHLKTTTKIVSSPTFIQDEVVLNGIKQDIGENSRMQNCLSLVRSAARIQGIKQGKSSCDEMRYTSQKVKVYSENNFPTAAGLASSASGYAALVFAMASLLDVDGDVTSIARQGSGSASRSLHGGFVQWHKGKEEDGNDSIGTQLVPGDYWEDLRIIVVVVNDTRKKVGSTEGMQSTVDTSALLKYRVINIVDNHMKVACDAIKDRDFPRLGEIIMRESNQLHSVCLDTHPPLHYLNDVSFMVMDMIHSYNDAVGSLQAAYTFDAGPNACLFTTVEHASQIVWLLSRKFPTTQDKNYINGMQIVSSPPHSSILEKMDLTPHQSGLLKYITCTKVGDGPKLVRSGSC